MTGPFEPVVAIRTEQDEVDQQSQGEQERKQRDQCPPGVEDHPDFMHIKSPGLFYADLESPNPHMSQSGLLLALLQPGAPHPSQDMGHQGDSCEAQEAFDEDRMEFSRLSIGQPRETTFITHGITSLVKDQFDRSV
jgi:hypothetical protein